MAFVDEMKFHARAGKGGDGVVRWRKEKFIPKGGPAGGNGGRGGDVYVEAVRDNQLLSEYRHITKFEAPDGKAGEKQSKHGRHGDDLVIKFPVGSLIRNQETKEEVVLLEEGQKERILRGGRGGLGNEEFKSSTNVAPRESTPGQPGEEADFYVELQLIADVGLVGLPNAGKSSLLNALTKAKAKIGDYAFTTLDPNLGSYFGYIIADIPGLIEGASEGKGLGTKFLKHVRRTKMLVHLVSFENEKEKGGMMKVYKEVRKELESYGNGLSDKEEIILLSKTDTVDEEMIQAKMKEFQKLKKPVYRISLFDDVSVKEFSDELVKYLRQ